MKKAETSSLTYSPRNAWDVYTTATQKRQMDALVKRCPIHFAVSLPHSEQ